MSLRTFFLYERHVVAFLSSEIGNHLKNKCNCDTMGEKIVVKGW